MDNGVYIHAALMVETGAINPFDHTRIRAPVEVWLADDQRPDGKFNFTTDFSGALLLTGKAAEHIMEFFQRNAKDNKALFNMHFHTAKEIADGANALMPKHIRELIGC